jgi:hypothetical protein
MISSQFILIKSETLFIKLPAHRYFTAGFFVEKEAASDIKTEVNDKIKALQPAYLQVGKGVA